MRGPARVAQGALTDAARPIRFGFDGRELQGLAGDTLASALLANGQRLIGRSFKYHRPRGLVTAGPEEPCGLVDVLGAEGREPNRLATTLELQEGLAAESQNRWPSLRFDLLAINDLCSRFLPAGFYYKTFMAPGWAWERFYEPLIRRAAGLGRLEPKVGNHAAPAETVHDHTGVLIVGGGVAGLAAARTLGESGVRVMLAEQDVTLGAGALLDARWDDWRVTQSVSLPAARRLRASGSDLKSPQSPGGREQISPGLEGLPGVTCLTRTTVLGAYGHGVFGALETLTPEESARFGGLRERLRIIRAKRVIFATGSVERLIAFADNDRPGVMLAGAALSYLRRYGVAVGRRPAFFLNNDSAYDTVFAMIEAGVQCAGIIDVREASGAADRAESLGVEVHRGATVEAVAGRDGVRGVRVARAAGRHCELETDTLLISGGYSPATSLATQLGAELQWEDSIAAFVPSLSASVGRVAGAARGVFGLAAAARDGDAAARAIALELGHVPKVDSAELALPSDPDVTPLKATWEVPGRGKAFVDLQNDVTTADVRLAHREGYEHVEHMKRFTTHGMATDQGRIGGLVGSAVLAQARGVALSGVGQLKPRPFAQPVPFAALAGGEVRQHFKPKRRLPLHAWHETAGATFVNTGLWLRPLVYSREAGWDPVLREARAVRQSVGITDVSTLGKIDVQGPDAAQFLDFLYANSFSTLAIGRARYGVMLREDGMMFDDGTTARLGPQHFLVTTTTANASPVFEHMEFHSQASCPHLDVVLTDVGDQWAQFAVAGPNSRAVVAAVVSNLDLSNSAFPFMAASEATLAGIAGRLFRISFSGELAYELAVPARHAATVWAALLVAGEPFGITPYGLDALNTLRIEKGHVTGAELNGNTSAADLGFERMLKKKGDFIGRTLALRPAMTAADRLQLVGVRPVDRTQRLRNGTQLVTPQAPSVSLGYITSSTPSISIDGWVGLALLAGGRQRFGERLLGVSPIHETTVELEIMSPHWVDPENVRVRA
ncbi:MAG: 2Fe-2S iron-sulfur cluster-binding protein [Gammaproteobacteria bacterium]